MIAAPQYVGGELVGGRWSEASSSSGLPFPLLSTLFWSSSSPLSSPDKVRVSNGPKWHKIANLLVVDHLGQFRVHLDPFGSFQAKIDISLKSTSANPSYLVWVWWSIMESLYHPSCLRIVRVYPNVITMLAVKTIKIKSKQRGNWDFLATEAILWLKCKIAINISWLQTYGVFIFHQYQIGVNALWPASLQIAFAIIFFANKPTQLFQGWMNFY